jgi:hypothetical protein
VKGAKILLLFFRGTKGTSTGNTLVSSSPKDVIFNCRISSSAKHTALQTELVLSGDKFLVTLIGPDLHFFTQFTEASYTIATLSHIETNAHNR